MRSAAMSDQDVCSWLDLPPGSWPPDYYTLLGLAPGDTDAARIEHQVHERMFRLRCRQLAHPENVTEAMNLLARAYACLTDPAARQAYDTRLAAQSGKAGPAALAEAPPAESANADPLAWLFGPWHADASSATDSVDGLKTQSWQAEPPPQRVPDPEPPRQRVPETEWGFASVDESQPAATRSPVDVAEKAARSAAARQGLGTKRALYGRIARTRQLLRAWTAAGKYLSDPERRLHKASEAQELSRQLAAISDWVGDFPPMTGEAGQPGFYVITLASQPRKVIVPTYRMLLTSQREMLARDWRDGYRLLTGHRRFLREELRTFRRARWWGRTIRAVDRVFSEHPGWLLAALVVVALVVAVVLGARH
jgi:hypothetical protein